MITVLAPYNKIIPNYINFVKTFTLLIGYFWVLVKSTYEFLICIII